MQQQRHLAAILFTDIVGYTAMMQENEVQAVAIVKKYLSVLQTVVAVHSGKILNDYGDGSLCTFPSAIEAVQTALELQEKLKEEPAVPLRIGLHIGEIFFEDEKVFGDGVNVASRIQSLGQANTILLSGEVNNKIRNHPEFSSVSLGWFEFKNVDEPVEVFALSNAGLIVPKKEQMTGKLKEIRKKSLVKKSVIVSVIGVLLITAVFVYNKFEHQSKFTGKEKSIAVLPFTNLSSDKNNEYFSDGLTEEITTQLSKIADLKVIARTSTALYKGSKKTIKQIAEELGVASILEGSVQKIGNDIRITAQLIDANTQQHLWAEKYDREFKEVFAIQSEVAQQIAYWLNAKITSDEKKRIEKVPTRNTEAYQHYLQGFRLHMKFFESHKTEYYTNSKLMFEKAISLDSNYALAHAGLADLYNSYTNHIKRDTLFLILQKKEIEKAWSIDSTLDYVNVTMGFVQQAHGQWEESFKCFRRAVELSPNNAYNLQGFAQFLTLLGLHEESKILTNKTINLDPLSAINFITLADIELNLYNLAEAEQACQTALQLAPDFNFAFAILGYIYSLENRFDQAGKIVDRSEKLKQSYHELEYYFSYIYAKLGHKKKALEVTKDWKTSMEVLKGWRTYLVLGMKEEALEYISAQTEKDYLPRSDYIFFKTHLHHKDFDIIRNDPRFLELMEKKRIQYEINKKKFNIAGILN